MINQILTGDARELAKQIPDESVDFVFADPVYENPEDYAWLAEFANRVLKPNSACLAWTSTRCNARNQIAMESTGLTYQWTLYYAEYGRNTMLHLYGLLPKVIPCLYFTKGRRKATPYIPDLITNADKPDVNKSSNHYFGWQKNVKILRRYIESFSKPGDLIVDPFIATGSTAIACVQTRRNYIGYEIDPERAEIARQRIESTPKPLFYYEPEIEQTTLDFTA